MVASSNKVCSLLACKKISGGNFHCSGCPCSEVLSHSMQQAFIPKQNCIAKGWSSMLAGTRQPCPGVPVLPSKKAERWDLSATLPPYPTPHGACTAFGAAAFLSTSVSLAYVAWHSSCITEKNLGICPLHGELDMKIRLKICHHGQTRHFAPFYLLPILPCDKRAWASVNILCGSSLCPHLCNSNRWLVRCKTVCKAVPVSAGPRIAAVGVSCTP